MWEQNEKEDQRTGRNCQMSYAGITLGGKYQKAGLKHYNQK